MASELSSFIEKELEQRGINDSERRRLVTANQRSSQQPQRDNTARDMKTSRTSRYLCVIGGIAVIVVVWIVLLSTGETQGNADSEFTIGEDQGDNQKLKSSINMNDHQRSGMMSSGMNKEKIFSPEVEDEDQGKEEVFNPAEEVVSDAQQNQDSAQEVNIISLPEFESPTPTPTPTPTPVPAPEPEPDQADKSPEPLSPSPETQNSDKQPKNSTSGPEVEESNKSANETVSLEVSGEKLGMSEPGAENSDKSEKSSQENNVDSEAAATPSPEVSKQKEKEEKSPKPKALIKPSRDRVTAASRLHQGARVGGITQQNDPRHGG